MVSPIDDSPKAGAPSLDGLVGRLVAGKFEIVELLGSGAMGAVYRAEQVALDKHVALKILHPSLRQDDTFVRRFHREAKAAAALEHPNSVSILDFGEEPDGLLYIAMEYLDGRDLFQVIQEEWPLPKERIVTLMRQVCGAVARAHDTGVVHRDLKPENIMVMTRVGDDGEQEEVVKVCDFGIAHLQKSPDESAAGKGLLVGTPEYMAPEVARGEEPDGRSDLYALGVVLYQILTKRLPFEGGDPLRVAMQHVQDEPVPPHQLVADVDSYLEDVALMAMAKSPSLRFGTARQMRGALRAALENREYSAADLSGVLSVLPPNVAARLISAHAPAGADARAVPAFPAAAPLPDLSSLGEVRIHAKAPPPVTPMGLSVSDLEVADLGAEDSRRLDTGGRQNAEISTGEPQRPAKLPWFAAAAAAAVLGLAGFALVARDQARPDSAVAPGASPPIAAETRLAPQPAASPAATPVLAAPASIVPTPVSLTAAPAFAPSAAAAAAAPAPASHAAAARATAPSKAAPKKSKAAATDTAPDHHEDETNAPAPESSPGQDHTEGPAPKEAPKDSSETQGSSTTPPSKSGISPQGGEAPPSSEL